MLALRSSQCVPRVVRSESHGPSKRSYGFHFSDRGVKTNQEGPSPAENVGGGRQEGSGSADGVKDEGERRQPWKGKSRATRSSRVDRTNQCFQCLYKFNVANFVPFLSCSTPCSACTSESGRPAAMVLQIERERGDEVLDQRGRVKARGRIRDDLHLWH